MKETSKYPIMEVGLDLQRYICDEIKNRIPDSMKTINNAAINNDGRLSDRRAYRDFMSHLSNCMYEVLSDIQNEDSFNVIIEKGGGSHNYPMFNPLQIKSIAVNDYSFIVKPDDSNPDEILIDFEYLTGSISYNKLKFNEEKNIYEVTGLLKSGNSTYFNNFKIVNMLKEGYVYKNNLVKQIESDNQKIKEIESKLENFKAEMSKKKFILDYMVENKIENTEISVLKSKMIFDTLKNQDEDADTDDASQLSNINEILSINI